jgi:hypothetical protein
MIINNSYIYSHILVNHNELIVILAAVTHAIRAGLCYHQFDSFAPLHCNAGSRANWRLTLHTVSSVLGDRVFGRGR